MGGGSFVELDQQGSWRRTAYAGEVNADQEGSEVIVFGWVQDVRDLGGIKFFVLRDRSGSVQVTLPRGKVPEEVFEKFDKLQKEFVVGVKGVVRRMEKAPRGVEIIPNELRILNVTKHPLPLDPTGRTPADIDTRLNARILDLRRPESNAIFRIAHVVLQSIRAFLSQKGFIEVQTPKIIASATEGGAALFPIAYFDREAFLAQSPQLYKEQLIAAFEKVFEIGPFFRAEESHTNRHINEFISVDIEEAFADAKDVMRTLEELVQHVVKEVNEKCKAELNTLKQEIPVPELPLMRITYDEALEILRKKGVEVSWGEDIPTPGLRALGQELPGFYFIVDWPTATRPFYIKPYEDRPHLCESFDLMHSWIELASGGTRIHQREELEKRLVEQGLNPASFEFHLKVFEYGMPPHAGWGLGLARLLMAITGRDNIREVVLFPRDRFRLTP